MQEKLKKKFKDHKNKVIILFLGLLILDILVWYRVLAVNFDDSDLKINFLDVGQGDAELVILPGGVKMLIDGGPPNGKVLENLSEILSPTDRYIDLVMMSHPQLDHFGGLVEVLKRYKIGAFLWTGRDGTAKAFNDLMDAAHESGAQVITLKKGDRIRYGESGFSILSPASGLLTSKELNDTSLVVELFSKNSRTLFTGDIGIELEEQLIRNYNEDIDILKVPHHGSKFSSGANFLAAVRPEIAVIEVGKNSYGHPTNEALGRLKSSGASIYRTDGEGNIEVIVDGEKIRVFK